MPSILCACDVVGDVDSDVDGDVGGLSIWYLYSRSNAAHVLQTTTGHRAQGAGNTYLTSCKARP